MTAGVTCPKKASRAVLFLTEALPSVPWGENVIMETQGKCPSGYLHEGLAEAPGRGTLLAALVHRVHTVTVGGIEGRSAGRWGENCLHL